MSGFADVCKIILLYSYYTAVQINNSLAEDTIFVGFVLGFFVDLNSNSQYLIEVQFSVLVHKVTI